jgi:cytoskeletal protein CcmA (bactofilin family)
MQQTQNKAFASSFFHYLCLRLLLPLLLITAGHVQAQNVGVGTSNPLRKLSVTGSIMVDQNSNNMGTLDSAALVFGNSGSSGISSRKSGGGDHHNLRFWTGGVPYMNLSPTGNLGVGGDYGASYRLWVRNGNTRLEGDVYMDGEMTAMGNSAIGGNVDPDYRLRVWGGNARIGGDFHSTGNVGIGGLPDNNFRLRVYDGETRLGGSLQVTGHTTVATLGSTGNISTNATITAGNINVNNSLTIDGKGSVRSNGPSPLRIGFDVRPVSIVLLANSGVTLQADITDFAGNNSDVRVMLSQIDLEPGNTMFLDNLIVHVVAVDAATDTCTLRLVNRSNVQATLVANIYLTTIAKN